MPTAATDPATLVTVFGGTGFLGRRIVRKLHDTGFDVRIASRHPDRGRRIIAGGGAGTVSIRTDINDDGAVAASVAGCFAVVNAVSLYVERGSDTFRSVHIEAAARVARQAAAAHVEKLVHISGLGADARSRSAYIRSRGEGEAAVLHAYPSAILIRPSVMFGVDDAFLVPLTEMLRRFPAFPLFGSGDTKLQPVDGDDVAEAIARLLRSPAAAPAYELAGPQVYTYRALVRTIGASLGKTPILLPTRFTLWRAIASISEFLPAPPITRNQVELMQQDNIASPDMPGFADLGMRPRAIEEVLAQIAGARTGATP